MRGELAPLNGAWHLPRLTCRAVLQVSTECVRSDATRLATWIERRACEEGGSVVNAATPQLLVALIGHPWRRLSRASGDVVAGRGAIHRLDRCRIQQLVRR